jgi:putative transposase
VKESFPRRPPHLDWVFEVDPLYFVTFCTYRRHRWLACSEVHQALIRFGQLAETKFNIALGRYVLMPDHAHLFVRGGPDFFLEQWIGKLKQALSKAGRRGREGRAWQEGFFDHVLRNDESYTEKWIYVRENPVRAGLVKSWEDWPYQGEIVYIDRV